MKNLFRIILALTVASLCRAQQVNGGGTSATSISTVSKIVNDVTTNATMFPVWVTANSGNLPLKVSSTLFQFNPSTGNMNLSGGLILGSTAQAPATMLQVIDTGTGTPRGIMHDQYNTGTNSAQINTRKARGTFASPTTIVTGDILGRHLFWGYDGSNFIESGNIRFTSSGTIAATRVPSQFEVWTSTDATPSVLTKQLTIDNTGLATLTGSANAAGYQTATTAFNAQTGTSYTLLTSDNGKIVTLSNAGGITLTVPASLGAGFSCTIIQIGAGQVTVTASSTTIRNVYSNTKLVGQWAQATLTAYIADNFIFSGDTAP